ncbi:epoxide hydrolase family protein [Modestobacter altitudinis]|uniref:epoxide hydrolase family protein n=1 Tax=Modestobacter altitudinis TaxID=2213158 RepID=UPI0014867EAB|nr:epoxide hydrolase family protein [Modestobacter altitudinis]
MFTIHTIDPYVIEVHEAELLDLRRRLRAARWPEPSPDGWERGVPLSSLQEMATYWADGFDWRAQEAALNRFAQFRTNLDGQPLHFLHLRSGRPGALPLLMVHGWPSSPVEFTRVLTALTAGPDGAAFDVVVPSLPGYGASTPLEPGWGNLFLVAQALAALMTALGYDRYGVHGTDVGAGVAEVIAAVARDHVIGTHATGTVAAMPFGPRLDTAELSVPDQARAIRFNEWQESGLGYLHMQTTRPQTLAYALTDSPVGHLAWIVEKFHEWTDPAAAEPGAAVDLDQLLTNVSLSWFTRAAAASAHATYEGMQAYRAMASAPSPATNPVRQSPAGVAVFAADTTVRRIFDPTDRISHWSEFDRGGHFPAMETPELLISDLRAFFGPLRTQV